MPWQRELVNLNLKIYGRSHCFLLLLGHLVLIKSVGTLVREKMDIFLSVQMVA